jgi:hypothetical protein
MPRQKDQSALPFGLPTDFLPRYWRQQPLYLPGGAAAFLPLSPTRAQITAMLSDGVAHQTDGATVWFMEGLTSGLPGIEDLVTAARRWLEWHDVWCDVFTTSGPSSIGSHYDGSDNFTIQLSGNKTWFLSDPTGIHPDDLRRRVLCEPGLGSAQMPAMPMSFEVGAGDALYIPSTWIHWGLSDGDSTSVSLVVNVATPVHALQEQILEALRRDPAWSRLLAVGPGSAVERRRTLRHLITRDVPEKLRPEVLARVGDREGSGCYLKGQFVSCPEIPTDRSWAAEYVGEVDPRPEDVRLDADRLEELLRIRARRNLDRLLTECAQRFSRTSSDDARRIYLTITTELRSLTFQTLDSMLTDPDVCSWLAVAERDSTLGNARNRTEDPLAHALGLALLSELAPHLSSCRPVTLNVQTDEDGSLALRRAGVRLVLPDRPERATLGVSAGKLYRLGPGVRSALISLEQPDADSDGPGVVTLPRSAGVVALPRSAGGVAITRARSDWLARVAPGRSIGAAVSSTASWRQRVDVARAVLAGDPDATIAPHPFVSWLLVRDQVTGNAYADPVPELPGLVLADAREPSHLAVALASARARAEFDLVAEIFPLIDVRGGSATERRSWTARLRHRYVQIRAGQLIPDGLRPHLEDLRVNQPIDDLSGVPLTAWGHAAWAPSYPVAPVLAH